MSSDPDCGSTQPQPEELAATLANLASERHEAAEGEFGFGDFATVGWSIVDHRVVAGLFERAAVVSWPNVDPPLTPCTDPAADSDAQPR